MRNTLTRWMLILGVILLSQSVDAVQNETSSQEANFNVPQEILDRLPEEQVAPFLMARQKLLANFPSKSSPGQSVYEEVKVSRNTIERIPDDQLFQFFVDLKYIEVDPTILPKQTHHPENSPPSPEQLLKLLFWVIGGVLIIVGLAIFMGYKRRIGEQEILLRAIENGEVLPLNLFEGHKQKSFLRWGIILLSISGSIALYGIFNHISIGIAIIPGSIGIGFLMAGILVRD